MRRLRANDGTELDLGVKGIGEAGAAAVARALQGNHTLTRLDLDNTSIGAAGVVAVLLAPAAENTALTSVDLCNTTSAGRSWRPP